MTDEADRASEDAAVLQALQAIESRLARIETALELMAAHAGLSLTPAPDEDKRQYGVDNSHRTFGQIHSADDDA